ncbi:unnamed protein product [Gongylonema pulchrum]|uniref:VWFA domain-containing protein n=1 Tax=Gongylonema pulchrum TaxID=637853 RepID=A0A183CVD6_9BILA|nr:unnamed protein product [Gongylonema pulchrum]
MGKAVARLPSLITGEDGLRRHLEHEIIDFGGMDDTAVTKHVQSEGTYDTTLQQLEAVREPVYELHRSEEMGVSPEHALFLDSMQEYKSVGEGAVFSEPEYVTQSECLLEQEGSEISESKPLTGLELEPGGSSSFGEKLMKFAKGTGTLAGAVVLAPAALVTMGAASVYEYAKKDDDKKIIPEEARQSAYAFLPSLQQTETDLRLIGEERQNFTTSEVRSPSKGEIVGIPGEEDTSDVDSIRKESVVDASFKGRKEAAQLSQIDVTAEDTIIVQSESQTDESSDQEHKQKSYAKDDSRVPPLTKDLTEADSERFVEQGETLTETSASGSKTLFERLQNMEASLDALSFSELPEIAGIQGEIETKKDEIKGQYDNTAVGYQLNVDGLRQLPSEYGSANQTYKPYSMKAEHSYEKSASISWTPEEAQNLEGTDAVSSDKVFDNEVVALEAAVIGGDFIEGDDVAQATKQIFPYSEDVGDMGHEKLKKRSSTDFEKQLEIMYTEPSVQLTSEMELSKSDFKVDDSELSSTSALSSEKITDSFQKLDKTVVEHIFKEEVTWPEKEHFETENGSVNIQQQELSEGAKGEVEIEKLKLDGTLDLYRTEGLEESSVLSASRDEVLMKQFLENVDFETEGEILRPAPATVFDTADSFAIERMPPKKEFFGATPSELLESKVEDKLMDKEKEEQTIGEASCLKQEISEVPFERQGPTSVDSDQLTMLQKPVRKGEFTNLPREHVASVTKEINIPLMEDMAERGEFCSVVQSEECSGSEITAEAIILEHEIHREFKTSPSGEIPKSAPDKKEQEFGYSEAFRCDVEPVQQNFRDDFITNATVLQEGTRARITSDLHEGEKIKGGLAEIKQMEGHENVHMLSQDNEFEVIRLSSLVSTFSEDQSAISRLTEDGTGDIKKKNKGDELLQQVFPIEDIDERKGMPLDAGSLGKISGIALGERSTPEGRQPFTESLLDIPETAEASIITVPVALSTPETPAQAEMLTKSKTVPGDNDFDNELEVELRGMRETIQHKETIAESAVQKNFELSSEFSSTAGAGVDEEKALKRIISYEDWQQIGDDGSSKTKKQAIHLLAGAEEPCLEEISIDQTIHEKIVAASGESEDDRLSEQQTTVRSFHADAPKETKYEPEQFVVGGEEHQEKQLLSKDEVKQNAEESFSAMLVRHNDFSPGNEPVRLEKHEADFSRTVWDSDVEDNGKPERNITLDNLDAQKCGRFMELEGLVLAPGNIELEARSSKQLESEKAILPTSEEVSEGGQRLTGMQFSPEQDAGKISSEVDEKANTAAGQDTATKNYVDVLSEQMVSGILREMKQTTKSIPIHAETSSSSEEQGTTRKYSSQVEHEPEVDYESDLMEKLEALAQQSKQLEIPAEGEIYEDELNIQVAEMVDDIIKRLGEDLSRSASTYKTATATSRDGYETCVTSQEDTFETAAGWHSQDSEYTTAASEVSSRLSEISEERRGSATPIAMLSPVQSDRLFTASQDEEQEPTRHISPFSDSKRSSPDMPDIELVPVEDEEEMEDVLLTSASGILLAPDVDPGRPISPIPPGVNDDDEGIVVVASPDSSRKATENYKITEQIRLAENKILDSIVEAPGDDVLVEETTLTWTHAADISEKAKSQESIHEKAMDFGREYLRQYSDLSSGSKAETVVDRLDKEGDVRTESLLPETMLHAESDSVDSLDKISIRSGSSGKRYSTSRRSSTSSKKSTHDEPQTFLERLTPELKMTWTETEHSVESPKRSPLSPSEEYSTFVPENEQSLHVVEAELETVDEEPEEADSLNGRSASSNGQGVDISMAVGKYKTVSSDNVSETSLQEFERIERDVLNKGESSLSGSEMELYVSGKLKPGTNGSTSSLAEFERLEQEVGTEGSPQDDAMMLSDIREESEVEDMSVRDDDEEDHDSIPDIQAIPVVEDTQVVTPLASPHDSIEKDFEKVIPEVLETSTDSLEAAIPEKQIISEGSLVGYEVVDCKAGEERLHDSLEIIPQDKDSVLEGASIQELTSQDTQVLLSGDTTGTYQEYQDEEKDSLTGDMDTMLGDYPTTLTTFETTQVCDDGSTEVISRRVLTRVTDPIINHVQFTGTENEHRVRDLEREEEFETVDAEGNVTRTTLHRNAPFPSSGISLFFVI